MVREPVATAPDAAVLACISSPLPTAMVGGDSSVAWVPRAAPTASARGAWSGFGRLLEPGIDLEAREEQGLVDPTLEDRDAHLHALRDHFAALKSILARKLGGRQVIGHRHDLLFLLPL